MRRHVVRRAGAVAADLAAIRRHLIDAYEGFGDAGRVAAERATRRVREAFEFMRRFATHPGRGTVHPELRSGIPHVTHGNFVFYFEIDEQRAEVTILAVSFGGADHPRYIVSRLAR